MVASDPTALQAATGLTGVLGPFTSRLSNAGETIELKNNNGRLMDRLSYKAEFDWPVAADGAGPSLAKLNSTVASSEAANWTASTESGGTPGGRNFVPAGTFTAPPGLVSYWNFNETNTAVTDLVGGNHGSPGAGVTRVDGLVGSGAFALDATTNAFINVGAGVGNNFSVTDGLTIEALLRPGWSGTGNATIFRKEEPVLGALVSYWSFDEVNSGTTAALDPISGNTGSFLGSANRIAGLAGVGAARFNNSATDGVSVGPGVNNSFLMTTGITVFARIRPTWSGSSGDDDAIWRAALTTSQITSLAAGTSPLTIGATGNLAASTRLPLAFQNDGNNANATFATLASRGVDNATLEGPFSIPATNLFLGDNVLAVEVHQTAASSSDVVFGLALDAVETVFVPGGSPFATEERPKIAFNELASSTNANFWFELVNHGASDVDLGGYVLARLGGTNRSYVFPSQTLAANSFLQVTKAIIGFGVDSGDKLVLYAPDGVTVLDAVVAKKEPRGRSPDATGPWQFPSAPTPAATNVFAFHDEIVINEIMYNHRPLPAVPALYGPTNLLLIFTNGWRYHAQGLDHGTAWSAAGYDDSAWPVGAALLYNSPSTFPVSKNTLMSATNAAGQRIITYYFRTTFNWAGGTNPPLLSLRAIVDDGAIYYLNGVEVLRQNMPAGNVSYNTVAASAVGVATFSGPFALPLSSLVAGMNVLAVEVHRISTVDNGVVFGAELSASEILSPSLPRRESPESWVELFNRSSNTVNLTGWRLDEGIDYRFAAGKTIAPGGFLVIAKDVAYMQALYPGLDVVGPFTNKLSKTSDLIVLKDANNNPADEVRYFDGGRWPEAANGGGSSLELRDPLADTAQPEAWGASEEGAKSSWVWYTNRATAVASPQPSTTYNEFILGLLDAGECLIDDLRLVESPTNAPVALLQNGTFTGGLGAWRIIGNHYGSVVPDPLNGGNNVLRLLATGPTEYLHNHAETTLKNGGAYYTIVNGRQYEYSFRAKWISGNNLLNARLWMNRAPRTFELSVPALNGTPGAPNSRLVANLGPTCANLRHTRTVPLPGEPVTVSVEATDPQGVASANLFYSLNFGLWSSAPMNTTGDNGFSGTIPGASAGTVVNFYVQAADLHGAASIFPTGGTNSRALYQVDDGRAQLSLAHNLRIIMTPADSDMLLQPTNLMSNGRLGATVVWDEAEIYYDMGVRLKGSEHGRPDANRLGFFLDFRPDQLFRGIHSSLGVDRSGGWRSGATFGQDEIVIKHIISHAGGLPGMYDDLIRVITPRAEHTGPAMLQMARYGGVFLDSQYKDGGDGTAFEYDLLYDASATTGGAEGLKLPQESSAVGVPLASLRNDEEAYRLNFIIKNNRDADDYSGLIAALKAIGQPAGATFDAATEAIAENSDLQKFITNPANRRRYHEHLFDIITTTYNTAYMSYWTDHYDNFLPGQNFAGILTYIGQRASFVMSQLPTNAAFAITSNGGADFGTTNGILSLSGTAPLHVKSIEVNGVLQPVTWTSVSNWTVTVALYAGANALTVQGVDAAGLRRTNFVDAITVTNAGPGALLPVVINEWMADNKAPGGFPDPADGLFQDWFELFNPNTNAASLSGFHFTDNLSLPTKYS